MTDVPEAGWFNSVADFLGPAYWAPGTTRVQSFTTGTVQEVDYLVDVLDLVPDMRVLDLGCGPGRHSLELAARGYRVHGVDLSETFVGLARDAATAAGVADRVEFSVGDVAEIAFDGEFDAAICLCQGGFGLLGGREDAGLLRRFAAALVPRGTIAISAFHAYFALRYIEDGDQFDPRTGVNHETATLVNGKGATVTHDLWTTCFTAKELDLLARAGGLEVESIHGVTPGDYGPHPVALDWPELLLVARRPS